MWNCGIPLEFRVLQQNHYKVGVDVHASKVTFFVCGHHFVAMAIKNMMPTNASDASEKSCADMMPI